MTTTTSTTHPLAVVTGASSGIGLALAHELADHDFDLVIASDTAEIDSAANELRSGELDVVAVRADLTTYEGVQELVAAAEHRGIPDALVINAGVGIDGPFVETDLDDHLRVVALNVTGAVHLARRLLPGMVARGSGRVMFTSSIAATMPGPYMSTYNASKAFLLSFAEALRAELADSGVTVTALMPGPTDTDFFEAADMEDTKLGQVKKDDPADVARDGYEAMMAGKDHVVAGSMKNKAQAVAGKVLPAAATAKVHAPLSKPGSGAD